MEEFFSEKKALFYLELAWKFSERSKDKKTKVGCIIVTRDGVIYPGYNGDEIGGSNDRDSLEDGGSGFIHAEENAIIKFDPSLHKLSRMYLTHNPCLMCAKRIVNTRAISEVYFSEYFRERDGIELLRDRGIICEQVYDELG